MEPVSSKGFAAIDDAGLKALSVGHKKLFLFRVPKDVSISQQDLDITT
jgi:hypothetical protein